MARPAPDIRAAAAEQVAALKATRDAHHKEVNRLKAAADEEMWRGIADVLDAGDLLQVDVVAVTGFTRDHIAKRTKPYRAT
ncbi:hypothetical protein [Streptomyces sp. SM12]|uniref:hypothetical protein n=1 Tax=Streptomyces sp. SM12 TaxID=1071602 RepID=UPI000CD4C23D|nr:hypothetical protein [Streptomyces sp. SM12]